MNLIQIAEEKARELLREYKNDLANMTPQAVAQLAFMRGATYEAARIDRMLEERAALALEKTELDTGLNKTLESLSRRGGAGSPHS